MPIFSEDINNLVTHIQSIINLQSYILIEAFVFIDLEGLKVFIRPFLCLGWSVHINDEYIESQDNRDNSQ